LRCGERWAGSGRREPLGPLGPLVTLALALGVGDAAAACRRAAPAPSPLGELTVAVTDTAVDSVVRMIAPRLTLVVARDAGVVRGANAGWDVAVRDAADTSGFDLLYPSPEWHGPYLNQVYAWSEATHHFGRGVRTMEVRGHPWLVDVECVRCAVTGAVPDSARFTAGTLRVAWRRQPVGRR
jgi:hypothetical protein